MRKHVAECAGWFLPGLKNDSYVRLVFDFLVFLESLLWWKPGSYHAIITKDEIWGSSLIFYLLINKLLANLLWVDRAVMAYWIRVQRAVCALIKNKHENPLR